MSTDGLRSTTVHFGLATNSPDDAMRELGRQVQELLEKGHLHEAARRLNLAHQGSLEFRADSMGVLSVHSPKEKNPLLSVSVASTGLHHISVPEWDGDDNRGYRDIGLEKIENRLARQLVGSTLAEAAIKLDGSGNAFARISGLMDSYRDNYGVVANEEKRTRPPRMAMATS